MIYDWVKKNIAYRNDPYFMDTFDYPMETVRLRAGDCDDMSILIASLALAIGIPARYIIVSDDPSTEPSHVYAELYIEQAWVPLDPVMDKGFGWNNYSPYVTKRWVIPILKDGEL